MRSGRRAWVWILVLLCLAGCTAPQRDPRTVVLWHALESEEEREIHRLVDDFQQSSGLKVDLLTVPFGQLQSKFLVAAPADQGPDILLGPQDWLGVFATAQLLDPTPDEVLGEAQRQDLAEVALTAVKYQGKPYAYPLLMDSLALLRNTKLMPELPKDLDELATRAIQLQAGDIKGFYYDLEEVYFSFPFFSAYGAYMFAPGPEGLDPTKLGLATPGGIQAAQYLTRLRSSGLIPLGAKNDFAKSLFLEGKVAATLNGPWFVGDMRKAQIPYAIDSIPPAPGADRPASPLVGVNGIMLNHRCLNREGALKLMAFLGQASSVQRLSLASGRPPASQSALEAVSRDPQAGADIAAFARVARQGVPMPDIPAASAVWEPMRQALDLITKGEAPPEKALQETQQRILKKIQLMME